MSTASTVHAFNPAFNIVLLHPEIPNNTGNIGRTAAATGCRLHVIHPIGFDMDEKARRRAGLDYWHLVDCREHASWDAFLAAEAPLRLWLFTTRATRPHWQAQFTRGDYLLFGRETRGVDDAVHATVAERWGADHRIALPMVPIPEARSLNLATAAAVAVYEGLRQLEAAGTLPWPLRT
ncbi:MAG: tRNA (cytidine(34)-2'-O)-methyltransferase [Phycisphaerae bacterium]|nr:tRNA (cytidine(34)-2'-O)-methyltransferase [Phycisphaerae bacterium]